MSTNLVNFIPMKQNTNDNDWYFKNQSDQFAPKINYGDFVYIDTTQTSLEDGKTYLFFHKEDQSNYLIREVSIKLNSNLTLHTPTLKDENVDINELLKSYVVFGRVTRTIKIIEMEF